VVKAAMESAELQRPVDIFDAGLVDGDWQAKASNLQPLGSPRAGAG
jgi:hypothetical protein